MTPLHLEILFHAYAMADPYPLKTETHARYVGNLMRDRLLSSTQEDMLSLVPGSILLSITERGKAYVSMLLQTPLPVSAFVDPRTERVISAV